MKDLTKMKQESINNLIENIYTQSHRANTPEDILALANAIEILHRLEKEVKIEDERLSVLSKNGTVYVRTIFDDD